MRFWKLWFCGYGRGNAIADVLFGDYNPSGKLPMSFPRSVGQIPVYYSHLNTGRPYNADKPNKYTSRYFDEANGALYPFGYGLSYTTFTVSDVKLSAPTMKRDGKVTASVQVTNTGKREGATVVQMYLQDVTASMSRPVKQLKGFEKITLKPGETQTVSFPIDIEALKFWNQQMKYDAEPASSMSSSALIPHALRKASLSCCNALVRARRLRPLSIYLILQLNLPRQANPVIINYAFLLIR